MANANELKLSGIAAAIAAAVGTVQNDSEGAKIAAQTVKREKAQAAKDAEAKEWTASLFNPAQCAAIEEMVTISYERIIEDEAQAAEQAARNSTYAEQFKAWVAVLFPTGTADITRYTVICTLLRHFYTSPKLDADGNPVLNKKGAPINVYNQTPYQYFAAAVKALPGMNGKLPLLASGKSKATRYSAKTWIRGIDSSVGKLVERVNKVPKQDVDADALRAFANALLALKAAHKALQKRIAA